MKTKEQVKALAKEAFGPKCMVRFDDSAPDTDERKELDYQRFVCLDALTTSPNDPQWTARLRRIERELWRANVSIFHGSVEYGILLAMSLEEAAEQISAYKKILGR